VWPRKLIAATQLPDDETLVTGDEHAVSMISRTAAAAAAADGLIR
jgi:hypothetical protein